MKKLKSLLLLSILLISLSIFIAPVSAVPSEVWVDVNGVDDGTVHFDTIQEGINAVDDGGTVHVATGTYMLLTTILIDNKNISLIGDGQSTTILDGGHVDGTTGFQVIKTSGLDVLTQTNGYTTFISGFTIQNGYTDGGGGGMLNFNSSPTITNCIFINNSAAAGGGMYNWNSTSPTITNCTFSGNTAVTENGGGMYNDSSDPTITNCTFSGNTASVDGGGMYNDSSSSPTITNCTFSGNTASVDGGGMYNDSSDPTITNCIMWGDTANVENEIYNYVVAQTVNYNSVPVVTYSDVQGGYSGEGNIDIDPLFVNAGVGDLRLQSNSPCIDAGIDTSDASYGSVTDDILDISRPIGAAYDMGAYEIMNAETVSQNWSPVSLLPLQRTLLGQANSIWQCIEPNLVNCENEESLALAVQVQEYMVKATTMINPVLACGGLSQAIAIMEDISDMLSLN